MASYQKRGKAWQYTISNKGNPIRKGGFRTKAEAAAEAIRIESDLNKGLIPHLKLEPFDEYFENWINVYKQHVNENTRERYKTSLETIKEAFEGKPIQHIKKQEYQMLLNEYGKTRSKATVSKFNSHVRACVREAIDEGIIKMDFTRNIKLSGLDGKSSAEKHLSYSDSEMLLKALHSRLDDGTTYYLLLLALTSGMRFAELVGLTRNDFDFSKNTITIDKTWGYTKRMSEGFGPTKNKQSERVIKIDKKTMNLFKQLFFKTPDNLHRLVFYSPYSKYKVISNATANKQLKKTLHDLGIDPISVHGLRHTHASILLYKKVSIYYVSERLGHRDIETTLGEYSHVIKELREEDENASAEVYEQMLV